MKETLEKPIYVKYDIILPCSAYFSLNVNAEIVFVKV